MNISKWVIDSGQTFGSKYILTGPARAKYAYKDGERTDDIEGYTYVVVLPERSFDAISVTIEGPCQIDDDVAASCPMVTFDGLIAKGYLSTFGGKPEAKLSVRANNIKISGGHKAAAN